MRAALKGPQKTLLIVYKVSAFNDATMDERAAAQPVMR
jgi:hypothetical protein